VLVTKERLPCFDRGRSREVSYDSCTGLKSLGTPVKSAQKTDFTPLEFGLEKKRMTAIRHASSLPEKPTPRVQGEEGNRGTRIGGGSKWIGSSRQERKSTRILSNPREEGRYSWAFRRKGLSSSEYSRQGLVTKPVLRCLREGGVPRRSCDKKKREICNRRRQDRDHSSGRCAREEKGEEFRNGTAMCRGGGCQKRGKKTLSPLAERLLGNHDIEQRGKERQEVANGGI